MKIKEVKEILNHSDHHDDDDLTIHLSMPSMGPRAMVEVKNIGFGFDWERGKVIIEPTERVSIKTKEEDVYHMAADLLMDMATSKSRSYLCKEARQILLKAGYTQEQFEKYRHLFHREDKPNATTKGT